MLVALVAVLACIASVTSQQYPPQGPWESLTPPVQPSVEAGPVQPSRDEIALTDEEEFLVSNIPFKLPFKMDKKQTAVAMKLLKEAMKPVIKSKTLQDTVAYIDDALEYFVHDRDTQMYVTLFFDFMQDVYEGKQAERVDKIVRGFINDNSDEVTARTINDVWNYVADPFDRYFFDTMRSYVVRPISKAMNSFAERIGTWMGNDNTLPHTPYNSYGR
ncbi:hypothetical protein E2C01_061587 [Portunus trituberculatus]|uniref:Uncharacterized protein n=1 Tax=Portunus trituberculatus TaxID=210409 RepID=A0A5B7H8J8_PORTR|nr:hypothetical protein [Portunus trituberculatus]